MVFVVWDIDVVLDGGGLLFGVGMVVCGGCVFVDKCVMCYGVGGEGGVGDLFVGGVGLFVSVKFKKMVGSYWLYVMMLFDYICWVMLYNVL